MMRYGLVCLLLGGLAWSQAANPAPSPSQTAPPGANSSATAPGAPAAGDVPDASKVPMDEAVITITGICDQPAADKGADCKTVINRADFEHMINAVQPSMPQRARRQFATRYADAIVRAHKAHEMGLDQGPDFDEHLKIARLSIMSQQLGQALQKQAAQISDKDISDYYEKNKAEFEEADLHRVFIPHQQQSNPTKPKPVTAASKTAAKAKDKDDDDDDKDDDKGTANGEQVMKAEAAKLLVRAKAGEDFDKLQAEAFQVAGIKMKSPTTSLGKVRRGSLSPSQESVMDLKTGTISGLISDQSGYYIFKVGAKDTPTQDKVADEIRGTLTSERMQAAMEAVEHSGTPSFDDTYFGPAPPTGPHGGMPMPMGRPTPPPPPAAGPK